MASDWSGFKGGQNFSIPLHDNDQQYRTITTGLAKVQPDHCSPGYADWLTSIADPSLPSVSYPDHVTCHSVNGCMLSQGANRTYHIGVGEYLLETQMSSTLGFCSAFNVKLVCSGGAETSSPTESDPLGFTVDAETGAITGTPQRVRDGYKMRLRAVDAVEMRTDVAAWSFNVQEAPTFSINHSTGWTAQTNGTLKGKYHVGETHLLPKPSLEKPSCCSILLVTTLTRSCIYFQLTRRKVM